jgi:uncharacterized protein with PIN domain
MSQDEKDLVQRVSTMLLGELTQGRNRDLTTMRLDDLENEVFGLADRVSRCVAEALLQEQANRLSKKNPLCPCCQRELVPKPLQERTLQLRRGEAQWEEPVWRCLWCRRDFFPSVGGDGLCGGSGV